jgi:hypothetical protein
MRILFLALTILGVQAASAQKITLISWGSLVVLEGTTTPQIPLVSIENVKSVKSKLRFDKNGDLSIELNKLTKPIVDNSGVVYLPELYAATFNNSANVDLKIGKRPIASISIQVTNATLFDFISQNPQIYNDALIAKGENWYLMDDKKLSMTYAVSDSSKNVAMAASGSDIGYEQIIADPKMEEARFF